jgi:hypothetical protein
MLLHTAHPACVSDQLRALHICTHPVSAAARELCETGMMQMRRVAHRLECCHVAVIIKVVGIERERLAGTMLCGSERQGTSALNQHFLELGVRRKQILYGESFFSLKFPQIDPAVHGTVRY